MPAVERFTVGAPCWADLWTSDVEGSRTFYTALFGWEAQEPSEEFGGYFMFHHHGAPIAGGMGEMGPGMPADDSWKIYLSTEDIAEVHDALGSHGATAMTPAIPIADLGRNMVFTDPNGAVLGAWQPETFPGFAALEEPGAPSWFELFTRDSAAALDFYRAVFSWHTEVEGDSDEFRYSTLRDPEDTERQLAGVMDASGFLPQGVPDHWSVYWEVGDVDVTVALARQLGGTLVDGPMDTPHGRVATVTDPTGAQFKLRTPPV
jgi:predicted enzyme related to lactoylglutathione lyase